MARIGRLSVLVVAILLLRERFAHGYRTFRAKSMRLPHQAAARSAD